MCSILQYYQYVIQGIKRTVDTTKYICAVFCPIYFAMSILRISYSPCVIIVNHKVFFYLSSFPFHLLSDILVIYSFSFLCVGVLRICVIVLERIIKDNVSRNVFAMALLYSCSGCVSLLPLILHIKSAVHSQ